MENKVESILKLKSLQFENIEFHRIEDVTGQESKPVIGFNVEVSEYPDGVHRVKVKSTLMQAEQYSISLDLIGFFELSGEDITDEIKKALLTQNTVAIMLPYIRSEISLLTAQPGMMPIVLPAFDVRHIVNSDTEEKRY